MRFSALALAATLACPAARAATGGTPVRLPHSGYLIDATDTPIDDALDLTFRLFDAETAGTLEWEGECDAVPVAAGYFAVSLGGSGCVGTGGAGDAILDTSDLPPGATRWLEVQVGAVIVTPRLTLSPAPAAALAARAFEADKLGGHPASDFALATTVTELQGTVGALGTDVDGLQAAVGGLETAVAGKLSSEVDPKVGAITQGKWCTGSGGQIVCASDAPSGAGAQATAGAASAAACGPATAGYLWYDVAASALKMCNGAVYVLVGAVTAPPVAPTGFTAAAGNGLFTASWSAVSGAASYEIGTQPGSSFDAPTTTPAATTSLTVTGLTNFQPYTVAVRSVQGQWRSPWSSTLSLTPMPEWNCASTPLHAGCVSSSTYASCKAIRNDALFTGGSGAYWIDPDGATGAAPFLAACDMSTLTGGWTQVLNLATRDGVAHTWEDTTFWQGTSTEGAATTALSTGFKSSAFSTLPITGEVLVVLHDAGTMGATNSGYAAYDLVGAYQGQSFRQIMNAGSDLTITGNRKANSGGVATTRNQNRNQTLHGDIFLSFTHPLVVNKSSGWTAGRNTNRLATTLTNADYGHTTAGLGGWHENGGYATKYEALPISPYCSVKYAYGSAGTFTSGNASLNGIFVAGCIGTAEGTTFEYLPVDVAIYVR